MKQLWRVEGLEYSATTLWRHVDPAGAEVYLRKCSTPRQQAFMSSTSLSSTSRVFPGGGGTQGGAALLCRLS